MRRCRHPIAAIIRTTLAREQIPFMAFRLTPLRIIILRWPERNFHLIFCIVVAARFALLHIQVDF